MARRPSNRWCFVHCEGIVVKQATFEQIESLYEDHAICMDGFFCVSVWVEICLYTMTVIWSESRDHHPRRRRLGFVPLDWDWIGH